MKYTLGSIIEWCGKSYQVANIYQLTDEYMAKYELYKKDRVTLVNINDYNDVHDFAI